MELPTSVRMIRSYSPGDVNSKRTGDSFGTRPNISSTMEVMAQHNGLGPGDGGDLAALQCHYVKSSECRS